MKPSPLRGKRRAGASLRTLIAIGSLAAGLTAVSAAPRIEVDRTEVDLGEMSRGETRHVEFQIRNTGDARLEILSADAACGCTVAEFDPAIEPGKTGRVSATLNTAELDGEIGKSIVLETNDPARPKVVLVLEGMVLRSVITLPDERLIVRNFADGGAAKLLVRREAREKGELRVTNLRTTKSWLAASAKELDDIVPATGEFPVGRPKDWLLEVRLVGNPPRGQHLESLEFDTGLARQPKVTIPVFADISPPVSLPDSKLVLDTAPSETMIILAVRHGLDPADLRAEARPEGLSVELETGGGRFYKAHVRWKGGEPAEPAAISFSVNGEQLDLPVEFVPGTR